LNLRTTSSSGMMKDNNDGGRKEYLKAKFQIGSCKGPINFQVSQQVFHPDDVPPEKKSNRKEVKIWKQKNPLSLAQKPWNISTDFIQPTKHRSFLNFVRDRSLPYNFNYRSEVLQPSNPVPLMKPHKFKVDSMSEKERKQIQHLMDTNPVAAGEFKRALEWPSNPKLKDAEPFNFSTTFTKEELLNRNEKLRKDSAKNTQKSFAKGLHLKNGKYKNPIEQFADEQEKKRKMKRDFRYNPPPPVKPSLSCNRLRKEPEDRYMTFRHSGKWEYNQIEDRYMWSDTGSFEYDSTGDIIRIHNPNAMILAAPTLPRQYDHPKAVPEQELK